MSALWRTVRARTSAPALQRVELDPSDARSWIAIGDAERRSPAVAGSTNVERRYAAGNRIVNVEPQAAGSRS
ncbi:MAG TPA: hypothetical protein VIV11_40415 [Kofleriaceae bacterium]